MAPLSALVDFILHIDTHLSSLIIQTGSWSYLVLFLIIFCETGLVVTPFLPGDSLLFAAGALAAQSAFHITWLLTILITAAIVGDSINYWIGRRFGRVLLQQKSGALFIKPAHIKKTEHFFETHGSKAILFARFVPIVRTIAPFLAGLGNMSYRTFITYNILGGTCWISFFLLLGYFFGNAPFVKTHFSLLIVAIICISFIPFLIELFRHPQEKNRG